MSGCLGLAVGLGIDCKSANRHKGTFGDDGNVLKLDYGDGCGAL